MFPSRWGAGARLVAEAFDEGYDGGKAFLPTLQGDRLGLCLPMSHPRSLWFEGRRGAEIKVISQNWAAHTVKIELSVGGKEEAILVGVPREGLIVGRVPGDIEVRSDIVLQQDAPGTQADGFTALLTRSTGDVTAFSYVHSPVDAQDAARRAESGIRIDPWELWDRDAAWIRSIEVPPLGNVLLEELHLKAAVVLRQWIEGLGTEPGTAGMRELHRQANLGLFDFLMAARAWAELDPSRALGIVRWILGFQDPETGLVPNRPGGRESLVLPPVLVRTTAEILALAEDVSKGAILFPALKSFVDGWRIHRSARGADGLVCWKASNPPGREAGMPGSPRFAGVGDVVGADVNGMLVREIRELDRLAQRLGVGDDPDLRRCGRAAEQIRRRMSRLLWDPAEGFHRDLHSGTASGATKTAAIFLPLWSGEIPPEHRSSLLAHLDDGSSFRRPLPVPSLSSSDPRYGDGPWCGAVWPHLNAWICQGLRQAGEGESASRLARTTLESLGRWYMQEGVLFACYDPEGVRSPRDLAEGMPVDPPLTAAAVLLLSAEAVKKEENPPQAVLPALVPRKPDRRAVRLGAAAGVVLLAAAAVRWGILRREARPELAPGFLQGAQGYGGQHAPAGNVQRSNVTGLASPGEPGLVEHVRALITEGRHAEAADLAEVLLRDPGADPVLFYWLGAARLRLGDSEGARRAILRFLAAEEAGTSGQREAARRFLRWMETGAPGG